MLSNRKIYLKSRSDRLFIKLFNELVCEILKRIDYVWKKVLAIIKYHNLDKAHEAVYIKTFPYFFAITWFFKT